MSGTGGSERSIMDNVVKLSICAGIGTIILFFMAVTYLSPFVLSHNYDGIVYVCPGSISEIQGTPYPFYFWERETTLYTFLGVFSFDPTNIVEGVPFDARTKRFSFSQYPVADGITYAIREAKDFRYQDDTFVVASENANLQYNWSANC